MEGMEDEEIGHSALKSGKKFVKLNFLKMFRDIENCLLSHLIMDWVFRSGLE